MLFFLFRFFTKSVLGYNDNEHSSGLRLVVTFIIGFISLLVLTAITDDASKAGFISFMISLGVYLGFKDNIKVSRVDNLDKSKIENQPIVTQQESAKVDELESQLLIKESSFESPRPVNIVKVDNSVEVTKPEKVTFLHKINIFRSLTSKDIIIIATLIVISILLVTMYFNRVHITSLFDKEKVNEDILKDRDFNRTNYNARIRFDNNRLYYNIEIYNKYFGYRPTETNIDVIFVDVSGYSLEKVRIKASDLIKKGKTYYYKDNLQTKPEIFLKIHDVEITYTTNRLGQ